MIFHIILSPVPLIFQVKELRRSFIFIFLTPLVFWVMGLRWSSILSFIQFRWTSELRDWGGLLYYPLPSFVGLSSRRIEIVFQIILSPTLLIFQAKGLKYSSILFSPQFYWSSEPRDWNDLPYYPLPGYAGLSSRGIEMVFHFILSSTLLLFRGEVFYGFLN